MTFADIIPKAAFDNLIHIPIIKDASEPIANTMTFAAINVTSSPRPLLASQSCFMHAIGAIPTLQPPPPPNHTNFAGRTRPGTFSMGRFSTFKRGGSISLPPRPRTRRCHWRPMRPRYADMPGVTPNQNPNPDPNTGPSPNADDSADPNAGPDPDSNPNPNPGCRFGCGIARRATNSTSCKDTPTP